MTKIHTASNRYSGELAQIHNRPPASHVSSPSPWRGMVLKPNQVGIASHFRSDHKLISTLVPAKPIKFAHIGVVGGMGPLAGNRFCDLLISEGFARLGKEEQGDQTAPTYTLESRSADIGDRTAYLVKHKVADLPPDEKAKVLTRQSPDNPLWGMRRSISRIAQSDARVYVVTCNTAHAWAQHFPKTESMKFVHIVDAALREAQENPAIKAKLDGGGKVRIGLLATTGTIQNKIYQGRLNDLATQNPRFGQLEFVVPEKDVQENLVMKGIYDKHQGVKGNNLEQGGKLLREAAQHLIDKGVDALSLSCTEIPIVVTQEDFPSVPVIDANAALAREALNVSMQIQQEELRKGALSQDADPSQKKTLAKL